ncbi:Putative sigma-54 modulation protein [Candidatus Izimaplasma bacterium HR1]|jgi:putative sigma-54 modulation protein|uniref:ribosome hibernation-promoting factor, HPF/YfiA family n=1 Tax=Candidatus Izimoplasma sp. HR1 TaxID=1541959 RepID=UPI0004F859A3|nr:Putative sigma-54 modulation protein [Candidatus Izimaplasma bacterium HR1]
MNVQVRGKNGFEVTKAIETYTVNKLEKLERYFKEDLDAFVVCKIYKDHHKVEVTIPTRYYTMRAEVGNPDMYAAIDLTIDKLESQVRKHKVKITRSLQKRDGVSNMFVEDLDLEALETELVASPVRRKAIKLDAMSIEEAITALEMLGHDFYIFKNEETKHVNVAYLRNDGKYGVIETE